MWFNFDGHHAKSIHYESEVKRLRKETEPLRMERKILKKAEEHQIGRYKVRRLMRELGLKGSGFSGQNKFIAV